MRGEGSRKKVTGSLHLTSGRAGNVTGEWRDREGTETGLCDSSPGCYKELGIGKSAEKMTFVLIPYLPLCVSLNFLTYKIEVIATSEAAHKN